MSRLPSRFPRASLIQHAAGLESRINKLLDETFQLQQWAEDHDNDILAAKFRHRFQSLDLARAAVNQSRAHLWDLE